MMNKMIRIKTSNKILIGLIVGLFATISTVIIINGNKYKAGSEISPELKSLVQVPEFSNIKVEGNLSISVIKGEVAQLYVANEIMNDRALKISTDADTLMVAFNDTLSKSNVKHKIIIQMPELNSIAIKNTGELKIGNFSGDSLSIKADNSWVNVDSIDFKHIAIDLNNNAKIWAKGVQTNHLLLQLFNNSFCSCTPIKANKVSGIINEKSKFVYNGTVSEIHLKLDSTSWINRY
jgi:hypothetical protein